LAPEQFRLAFADARDRLGAGLAHVLLWLPRERRVTYVAVREALLEADRKLDGRFAAAIAENFAWREIGAVAVGPYLGSRRAAAAGVRFGLHRCAKREMSAWRGQVMAQV
jgi:hypothetical protein